jgi:hypothetical protein
MKSIVKLAAQIVLFSITLAAVVIAPSLVFVFLKG